MLECRVGKVLSDESPLKSSKSRCGLGSLPRNNVWTSFKNCVIDYSRSANHRRSQFRCHVSELLSIFCLCPPSQACIAQNPCPGHSDRIRPWKLSQSGRIDFVVSWQISTRSHMSVSQDLARLICGNGNGTVF